MSNQSRDYKKTIAIQMDLNWDGDPTLELEEEKEPEEDLKELSKPQVEPTECQVQNKTDSYYRGNRKSGKTRQDLR